MTAQKSPHLFLAHSYWKSLLRPGDTAIDATCGNGFDTLALAKLFLNHPDSALLGFDIQHLALEKTHTLLQLSLSSAELERVLLHRRSHAELHLVPLPAAPRLIVYNLGYLPGGDKSITTKTETTLESLHLALSLLAEEGALSITCYPGHPEGAKEEEAILSWASNISPSLWQVCHHRWINRPASPSFLWIRSSK